MKRIGLLSDTHGFIDDRLLTFFEACDEVWHAGDIGNLATADKLSSFRTFRAVYGNIDDAQVRSQYQQFLRFNCEKLDVLITHIGGYPGHYESGVRSVLNIKPPKLLITGHSHILKVVYDKQYQLLHINPGAAGNSGFHQVKTAVRFTVEEAEIKNLEIWEMNRR